MLYDGGCPLCMREVNMLKRRDEGKGKIYFVDIDAPDYRPEDNAGITYEQAMESIHGILPDNRVVTNVEVFRRLYDAVGLGWVYAITRVQPIGRLADW
ncbi:g260 [Coccomyxa elongata]